MLRETDQSKYHGVGCFHPFIRPSFLSVILVFVCGILFMKNEETNDRLFALEQQMAVVIEECDLMRLNARQEEIPTTVYNGESKRSTPTRSSMTESLLSTPSGRFNCGLTYCDWFSTKTPVNSLSLSLRYIQILTSGQNGPFQPFTIE